MFCTPDCQSKVVLCHLLFVERTLQRWNRNESCPVIQRVSADQGMYTKIQKITFDSLSSTHLDEVIFCLPLLLQHFVRCTPYLLVERERGGVREWETGIVNYGNLYGRREFLFPLLNHYPPNNFVTLSHVHVQQYIGTKLVD